MKELIEPVIGFELTTKTLIKHFKDIPIKILYEVVDNSFDGRFYQDLVLYIPFGNSKDIGKISQARSEVIDEITSETVKEIFILSEQEVSRLIPDGFIKKKNMWLRTPGYSHYAASFYGKELDVIGEQVNKKGGIMASTAVGGLSGAFIPVSEDQGMIDAVKLGALTIEKLEAMTCVCSVGLDMIAVPGDIKATTISGIIADEAAIGMINQKTTAVRLIPVPGKQVGDEVEFGGLLGYAPIMPVNTFSCDAFVNRGGRIPAPIHSFKN